MIVLGGTIGATMIQYPAEDLPSRDKKHQECLSRATRARGLSSSKKSSSTPRPRAKTGSWPSEAIPKIGPTLSRRAPS